MKVTPCECTEPGWCKRHQCEKPRHFYELCRRRQDYFEMFEKGQSFLQQTKTRNPTQISCRHRGIVREEVDCATCNGSVRIKVFDCPLHERCTVGKRLEDTTCCLTCEDFAAA
jgi:hypothetical protein